MRLSYVYFFLQKDFKRTKTRTSKNQLTKQKQANTKQERQHFLQAQKLLREQKSFVLHFDVFLRSNPFRKKNKQT